MEKELFIINKTHPFQNATERINQILDTEYNKMKQNTIAIRSKCLKIKHEDSQLELIKKYKEIFDGPLGEYTASNYNIELKEDAKLNHAKPFLIPKIYEPTLNDKVVR